MIRIMARITARPGCAAQLFSVLQALLEPSREEAGCLGYDLFQNEDNPQEFVTVEQWRDQAAADAHLATRHVQQALALAGSLLAEAPHIDRFREVLP